MIVPTSSTLHRDAQANCQLPARAGLGLSFEYFQSLLEDSPDIGFLEIHAENYIVDGGPMHHYRHQLHEWYPLSIHGVGLSIGSESALDREHLLRLKLLLERHQLQVPEHLAWSTHGPTFLSEPLPLTYDGPTLERVCEHIEEVQETLDRVLLLENPATYLQYWASTMDEPEFISEVVRRTGCGLLLDITNADAACINHGRDLVAYLTGLSLNAVGQIHLAGFRSDLDELGRRLLIDSHSAPIDGAVWALYRLVLQCIGPVPTLIERVNYLPTLAELFAEARFAGILLKASEEQQ